MSIAWCIYYGVTYACSVVIISLFATSANRKKNERKRKQHKQIIQNHQMSNDHQKTNTYFHIHNVYNDAKILNSWWKKYYTF